MADVHGSECGNTDGDKFVCWKCIEKHAAVMKFSENSMTVAECSLCRQTVCEYSDAKRISVELQTMSKENTRLKEELKKIQQGTDAVAQGVREKILELKRKVDALSGENEMLKKELEEKEKLLLDMVATENDYQYETPMDLTPL